MTSEALIQTTFMSHTFPEHPEEFQRWDNAIIEWMIKDILWR